MLTTLERDGIVTLGDLCHCTRNYLIHHLRIGSKRIATVDKLVARCGCALLNDSQEQGQAESDEWRKPSECPLNGRGF